MSDITYISLRIREGGCLAIAAEHWNEIDNAHRKWIERKIDTQLSLTCDAGFPVICAASEILSAVLSAPEYRQRERERDREIQAENVPGLE